MPVRSAPTQKMYGLPVTATNAGSAASAASMAASRLARPPGPNEFGFVWSNPLSNVISAAGRSSPGHRDLPQQRPGDDLGGELRRGHFSPSLDPVQRGFSQITVAPMPMPTHIAVRP